MTLDHVFRELYLPVVLCIASIRLVMEVRGFFKDTRENLDREA